MKYLTSIFTVLLSLNLIYGQVDFCYTIEESSRVVYRIAQDGSQFAPISQIAETSVEAIAWDRVGELWMFDAGTSAFYTLDLATGVSTFKFTAPSFMRSDNSMIHQIQDVDALDFSHVDNTILYGVDRISGSEDLLFKIDVITEQVVGNIGYPVTLSLIHI